MIEVKLGRGGVMRAMTTRVGIPVTLAALMTHAACSTDEPAPASPDTADASPVDSAPPSVGNDAGGGDAGGCLDDGKNADCSYTSDAGDVGVLPGDLRCTGLYECWNPKTLAKTAQPFKPGVELWSDGAEKARWLALPPGQKIDISKHDGWVFPVGTKVFKEFKIAGKRIETRIFQKVTASDWQATVYRWSADGESSAKRLDTGALVDGYEIPATTACNRCHAGRDDRLLGVEEWSLSIGAAEGLTMSKLKELGLVTPEPGATTKTLPEDSTGKAAAALGWLHANCGFCHNNRTGSAKTTNLFLDLALSDAGVNDVTGTPTWQTAMNKPIERVLYKSAEFTDGFDGGLRMKPSDAAHSLLPVVDAIRATDGGISRFQMPPLLSRKVDPKAAAVGAWINALPP
jgi:hypothetical protein